MSCSSHLPSGVEWTSTVERPSTVLPGVHLVLHRMTLARRLELLQQVHGLGQRLEFLAAGQSVAEQVEAALVSQEIDREYLRWGLADVRGLRINGVEATPLLLWSEGPEELAREALQMVRAEAGLDEEERKNSESPSIS